MNANSIKILKKPGIKKPAPATPAVIPQTRRRLVLALCLVLTCVGTWALFEYVIWSKIPSEFVGKWVVAEGPQMGDTFDFYRNGTMIGRVHIDNEPAYVNATVRIEGDKLYSTTRNPNTRQNETHFQVIRTLTEKDMVLVDEIGRITKLERAEYGWTDK
jgi:hypothetical protein